MVHGVPGSDVVTLRYYISVYYSDAQKEVFHEDGKVMYAGLSQDKKWHDMWHAT